MRIIHLFGAILLLFATPAMAKDGASESWIVTQRSGEVQVIRSGLQPASLAVRAALSPGDLIATGSNGRAMLTRGDDYIVVAPGSRLQIPKEEQARGFTRLIQQIGTMLYKVRHTGEPHFAVETPMLAAVVKGTSFTVVVDKDRSAVQVTDGVVEVSSAAGGVTAGLPGCGAVATGVGTWADAGTNEVGVSTLANTATTGASRTRPPVRSAIADSGTSPLPSMTTPSLPFELWI